MRGSWRDWGDLAVGIRGLGRQYSHDDGGDVVVSAIHVGFLDQSIDDSLGPIKDRPSRCDRAGARSIRLR